MTVGGNHMVGLWRRNTCRRSARDGAFAGNCGLFRGWREGSRFVYFD